MCLRPCAAARYATKARCLKDFTLVFSDVHDVLIFSFVRAAPGASRTARLLEEGRPPPSPGRPPASPPTEAGWPPQGRPVDKSVGFCAWLTVPPAAPSPPSPPVPELLYRLTHPTGLFPAGPVRGGAKLSAESPSRTPPLTRPTFIWVPELLYRLPRTSHSHRSRGLLPRRLR